MRTAIVRAVSPRIGQCELTHLNREIIDAERSRHQHALYEDCLVRLGCTLRRLPAEPEMPDSVFVEDTALVFDELGVIAHPGAASRRPEVPSVAAVLGEYRRLTRIVEPGTLDGGDILVLDRDVYIGRSGRTNEEGVKQIRAILEPLGYTVTSVNLSGCLHLKSAVGRVGPETLLINRNWVDAAPFRGMTLVDVDPAEPGAAGALLIGDTVVYPAHFERTLDRLSRASVHTAPVELSELAKAEAGVTCCSIVFES